MVTNRVSIDGKAAHEAARLAGESDELTRLAGDVASRVRQAAAAHSDTGDFVRSIKTARTPGKGGVTDRLVFSDDPAAYAIEFGWRDPRTGKLHPGKHSFTNTRRRLAGGV